MGEMRSVHLLPFVQHCVEAVGLSVLHRQATRTAHDHDCAVRFDSRGESRGAGDDWDGRGLSGKELPTSHTQIPTYTTSWHIRRSGHSQSAMAFDIPGDWKL